MKELNLVNKEKSTIKYTINHYPDGQNNLVIESSQMINILNHSCPIQIKSRLNNFLDLEILICACASLRSLGVKEIHLYTPMFLGQRSDRRFEEGGNNYLKDVICPIINSLRFESVTVLDPHSNVLEACLNNFKSISNLDLVKWATTKLIWEGKTSGFLGEILTKNSILISPDAGASHKIYKLAEQIGYKGDIITCSKERDSEGKLTKCMVPTSFNHVGKDFILVDDLIDGGITFINIAKELKRQFEGSATKNRIFLIVTHGIFSKGFEELSKYFDGIYCTNSYKDIKYQEYGDPKNPITTGCKILKQLNVF